MRFGSIVWFAVVATACQSSTTEPSPVDSSGAADTASPSDVPPEAADIGADTSVDTGPPKPPPETFSLTHDFGERTLKGYQESSPCVAWSLKNEQAVYVNGVALANDGMFHHSNWFVVPEATYPGPDGFFKCGDRNFQEIGAAISGTVIFAQSTQSRFEEQRLPPGVVVKVPPGHKVVSQVHLLNLSGEEVTTSLRMTLDLIHPRDVVDITTPFRLTYFDLELMPDAQTNHRGECNFQDVYKEQAGVDLDLKVYWVLPHYHYLGNAFEVSVNGGPRDGEVLHEITQFDGEAHGKAFDPPFDMTGSKGFNFTCGFYNPRDVEVGWGIGDQEMCVMLGLASSKLMFDGTVAVTDDTFETSEGFDKVGTCAVLGIPKNASQTFPTPEEIAAPLYKPPELGTDVGVKPVEECTDTPADAVPSGPATLASINDAIFVPACSYSACHGGPKPAAGLALDTPALHDVLLSHKATANTLLPLVTPGDPEKSWLYALLAKCSPTDDSGAVVAHMPRNAPYLLDPGLVARVRDWILAGAPAE